MKAETYFEPGTHVWIYTASGREPGTIDARQSGVYRVKFDATKHTELRKSADVSRRVA